MGMPALRERKPARWWKKLGKDAVSGKVQPQPIPQSCSWGWTVAALLHPSAISHGYGGSRGCKPARHLCVRGSWGNSPGENEAVGP